MAGETYTKRYPTGFTDLDNSKPVDDDFLNAVEQALIRLLGEDPAQDEVPVWTPGSGRFVFKKLTNTEVDPAAGLSPSKFAGFPNDASKVLKGDGSWAVGGGGGGGVALAELSFSASTTEPPGANQCRLDVAHPYTTISKIWVADVTSDGFDARTLYSVQPIGSKIYIQDKNDHTRFVQAQLTATPTGKSGYTEFAVSYVSNGLSLQGGQPVQLAFVPPSQSAGGADLVYNGAFPAFTPYTDGDIVVYNGVVYMCVRPTSAAPTPWLGFTPSQPLVKLADVTLSAASPTLCDVTIPAGYTDLIVRGLARSDNAAAQVLYARFNGDATNANYAYEQMQETTSSMSGVSANGTTPGVYACILAPTGHTASSPSGFDLLIPFYADTTWHKTMHARHGYETGWAMSTKGTWRNTAAINRLQLVATTGNIVAGSRVAIWGQR